jgi:hypothetical protein
VTPEGKVKAKVSALLKRYGVEYAMPVQNGMGKQMLDYVCCWQGRRLDIETKAPGNWLTPKQCLTALNMWKAGAKVFIISNPEGLAALERYLASTAGSVFGDLAWAIPLGSS